MEFKIPEINSERWLSLEDFPNEEWRDVVGYEGLYQVSDNGRVKSVKRCVPHANEKTMFVRERICKVFVNRKYIYVTLSKDGKQSNMKVHRLVAEAFIPNPDGLPQVNHKDENPSNNQVCNLEFCTNDYNIRYGTKNIRMKKTWRERHSVKVVRLNMDGSISKQYECTKDVELDGFDRRAVYRCCKDIKRVHANYKWAFA